MLSERERGVAEKMKETLRYYLHEENGQLFSLLQVLSLSVVFQLFLALAAAGERE